MKSSEIRGRFLNYFDSNGHLIRPSAPLLSSDSSLLFNIAGMVPFKPYFLGRDEPPSNRIVTAQKCLRTEDIEQVGKTARHLTFFEMLGNFSFGDYFKEEAIELAWSFLVEELKLSPDRLWVTVFGGDQAGNLEPDEEARTLWNNIEGLAADRVLRMGRDENFWAMGETGPCGPCSEILYDQGSTNSSPDQVKRKILEGDDQILELWNLVFMEFQRPEADAPLQPLPDRNIDTGLGLERLAAILQGADSNFGTDLFVPIIEDIRGLVGSKLKDSGDRSETRVIADHLRASAFLISEGLLPGNEGHGYVLRRLIRRAHLQGRRLGLRDPFLPELVPALIEIMGGHFEELLETEDTIKDQLHEEEKQFERILTQGLGQLEDRIERLQSQGEKKMDGREIFDLYETHGLPLEITRETLREEGMDFNEDEIEEARRAHREESRERQLGEETPHFDFKSVPESEFTGYNELCRESTITGLFTLTEENGGSRTEQVETLKPRSGISRGYVVLDKTPFYPEGGGQVGDQGCLNGRPVRNTVEVDGRILHEIPLEDDIHLETGQTITAEVNRSTRRGAMRHHSATHLLHAALRKELGDQVMQDGSFLNHKYLRFDFTHNQALDGEILETIEEQVNDWIYREFPITKEVMDRREAKEKGALAFFGEHYGEKVRVVKMGHEDNPVSMELCGGTHLNNTREVGLFTVTDETAVGSGVRRIQARAGLSAYRYLKYQQKLLVNAADSSGVQQVERLPERITELKKRIKNQKDELKKLRQKESVSRAQELAKDPDTLAGYSVVIEVFEDKESETLKSMIDEIRQRLDSGLVLLSNRTDSNVQMMLGITDDLTDRLHAGEIVDELGEIVGGGGGGRGTFAQAGGSDPEALDEAIDFFREVLTEDVAEASGS